MLRSLTTLILLSLQAGAADDHPYTCEVTHVYELSNDGILRPSNWENQNAREHLHGVARHRRNCRKGTSDWAHAPRVVNKTVSDLGDQYQRLEIREFREGRLKPFVAVQWAARES